MPKISTRVSRLEAAAAEHSPPPPIFVYWFLEDERTQDEGLTVEEIERRHTGNEHVIFVHRIDGRKQPVEVENDG